MKNKYILIIIAILCSVTFHNAFAQDVIIIPPGDLGDGDTDNPILIGETPRNGNLLLPIGGLPKSSECFCSQLRDIDNFNTALALREGRAREAWMREREVVLLNMFQTRLNRDYPTFEQGRKAFFKKFYGENILGSALSDLKRDYRNKLSALNKKTPDFVAQKQVLDIRKNEIYSGSTSSRLGGLKFQNYVLSQLNNVNVMSVTSQHLLNNHLNETRNAAKLLSAINGNIVKNVLADYLADLHIIHINNSAFEDRVRLMMNYLIHQNDPVPYDSSRFLPALRSYPTEAFIYQAGLNIANQYAPSNVSVPIPSYENGEAITRYAINTNFETQQHKNFILDNPNLKSRITNYLVFNRYSSGSLDKSKVLLRTFFNGKNFLTISNFYASNYINPTYQKIEYPNRVIRINHSQSSRQQGLDRLASVAAALYEIRDNFEHEGAIIRSILNQNDLHVPYNFRSEELGRIFNISNFGVNRTDVNFVLFDLAAYMNPTGPTLSVGPTSYCLDPNWNPTSDPETLYAIGPGFVQNAGDALWSMALRSFEWWVTDEYEGEFVRRVFEHRGLDIPIDVDNENLGNIFKVRYDRSELVVLYDNGIGTDLWGLGADLLDVLAILSPSRGGGAFLAARGGEVVTAASLKAFLAKLKRIGQTTLAGGRGHKSFPAFKRAEGNASSGNALHHIVEQNGFRSLNQLKFGKTNIHNTKNIIDIPTGEGTLHDAVTRHYLRIHDFTEGKRFREWISTKSFEEQYQIGLDVLRQYGWDGVTGIID